MKSLLIKLIEVYQSVVSLTLKNFLGVPHFCRQSPTCSEYSKRQIIEKGIIKGSYLSLLRILKCQPFTKVVYD